MIQFPCRCGHVFQLEDDQAGGLIQCPRCRLLNDIPGHGDLAAIADDGTYRLDAAPVLEHPEVVEQLARVYLPGQFDPYGRPKDLRATDEDIALVGEEPAPPKKVRHAPRYDPETGELITELEVQPDQPQAPAEEIPVAKAVIGYATVQSAGSRLSQGSALLLLLQPGNLFVMLAVLCIHMLIWPLQFLGSIQILFIVALPALSGVILAHYGNVIDEIGPLDRDELPRPVRDLEWYEDIWYPFCHMFLSLMICYLPFLPLVDQLVDRLPGRTAIGLSLAWMAAGTFFLPAVMLTLMTSGTILNLRPDRVMKVIGVCGSDYFVTLVAWIIAGGVYGWGCYGTTEYFATIMNSMGRPPVMLRPAVVFSMAIGGIYLMHWFCICVGLLYRNHYPEFPWVLQRHVRTAPFARTSVPLSADERTRRRRERPAR